MPWEAFNTESLEGIYLYKFLSQDNLNKFLGSGDIWFSRSDKFGDKMECLALSDFTKTSYNLGALKERQQRHLISCFHLATNESLAFWDTYAKSDDLRRKFAIRFPIIRFIDLIKTSSTTLPENVNKCIYGNVMYKNLISAKADALLKVSIKYPAFRKEAVFSYEKEFRFAIQLKNEFAEAGFNINIGDPKILRYKILVNPLLDLPDFRSSLRWLNESEFKKKIMLSKLTKWVKPELADMIERHRVK